MNKNKTYIDESRLFLRTDRLMVDWNYLMQHLYMEGVLSKISLMKILNEVCNFLKNEPNLLYLEDPINIVGDIHGQFHDTKEIFKIGGTPDNTKYLFLGDYVDRGIYGMEVLVSIITLKLNCPNRIFMLRGNHESRIMTKTYGFYMEVLEKYDQEVYDKIMDLFDNLPLGCVINGRYLAVHGGISPHIKTCMEINKLDRVQEPDQMGGMCDLLWSDPIQNPDGSMYQSWINNQTRGCSFYFGYDACNQFLRNNNLLSIIRAHEAEFEGFKTFFWQGKSYPQVITLFSAPNYCGYYANKGALAKLNNNEMKIIQYSFNPKPDLFLELGDAFTWTVPLLSNQLMHMFIEFLSFTNDKVLDTRQTEDLSLLNDTVLNALDIDEQKKNQVIKDKSVELTFLEQLVEEQKMRKKKENKKYIRRVSGHIGLNIPLETIEEESGNNILNESFNEHFNLMKHEDSINEGLPSNKILKQFNKFKLNIIKKFYLLYLNILYNNIQYVINKIQLKINQNFKLIFRVILIKFSIIVHR